MSPTLYQFQFHMEETLDVNVIKWISNRRGLVQKILALQNEKGIQLTHLSSFAHVFKFNVPKGIRREFFGVFLIIPFFLAVNLSAFYMLSLPVSTFAEIVTSTKRCMWGKAKQSNNFLLGTVGFSGCRSRINQHILRETDLAFQALQTMDGWR